MPTDLLPDFQGTDFWFGVYGGNPDLKPESADTYTLGFVLSQPFENPRLGRLQFSLDWYQMDVKDSIEFAAASEYVFWCYGASTNPQFELSDRWCGFFSRDPETGYIGGLIGTSYPEWKFSLDMRYDVGSLGVGGEWRYISSMMSRDARWNFRVPSQSYLGLFAIYAMPLGVLDGLTLRGGIENLTDEDPPLFPDYIAANTDPSQYDVLGRRYYLQMVYRF